MLEVLKFIFSSFWIFLGTAVLLSIIASPFNGMFKVIVKKSKKEE